jgi:hypothetical protein
MSEKHNKWYSNYYRRYILDFHVNDWNDRFYSKYNPVQLADYIKLSNSKVAVIMANSVGGTCNYPAATGKTHSSLREKDYLGELIEKLHENDVNVIVYYITVFSSWYCNDHPEACVVAENGEKQKKAGGSLGNRFACPNNPGYRDFVQKQIQEICTNYDFEGFSIDMCFWPKVCYCPSCQKRYADEVGGKIPRIINWKDPKWVNFQKKRQEWLAEYVNLLTGTVKKYKMGIPVSYQAVLFYNDWTTGPSVEMAQNMDWLWSDFYQDRYSYSLYGKLFYSLSQQKPFEYMHSLTYPMFTEQVITLTEDEMRACAFSAITNNGSMVFLDVIDPIGTLWKDRYISVGKIYSEIEKYEEHVGGKPLQDVAIYHSFESCFDLVENGQKVPSEGRRLDKGEPCFPNSHRGAEKNLTKTLLYHHIPFGVITKGNLDDLNNYQVVILPNVIYMSSKEVSALKDYVKEGGSIYASGNTSMLSEEGIWQKDFQLADLFGVSYLGETQEKTTYLSPQPGYEGIFAIYNQKYPVTLYDSQLIVKARPDTEVISTIILPFEEPSDEQWVSLTHAPDRKTDYPAIVLNRYGKGKVIYSAGVLGIWEHDSQRKVFANLLKLLSGKPYYVETDAPKSVEITIFDQKDKKRYVINILDVQQELPNIPIKGINVKINMDGKKPLSLERLPEAKKIKFDYNKNAVSFVLPEVRTFMMLELRYDN